MKKNILSLCAAVLAGLALFLAAEGAARSWTAARGDQLDKSVRVLEPDSSLGWKTRERLDTKFMGAPLRTGKTGMRDFPPASGKVDRLTVLVLGPSSSFGWGAAPEQTYCRLLEDRLRGSLGKATVINAGHIGYSSFQGLKYYRDRLGAVKAQVVVIAYGANDPDSHRFFFDTPKPDKEELSGDRASASFIAYKLASRSALAHLLKRRLAQARVKLFGSGKAGGPPAAVRVSADDFRANMSALAALARSRGARPVFVTTAFNFPAAPGAGEKTGRDLIPEALRRQNALVRDLGKSEGVPVLDAEKLAAQAGLAAALLDPVHFSPGGNALVARELAGLILKARSAR